MIKNFSRKFKAMGTDVSVDILAEPELAERVEESLLVVQNIFHISEKKFSRFDKQSELFLLNQQLNKPVILSSEMLEILQACLKYYQESQEYFDPRIIDNLENIGYVNNFFSTNFPHPIKNNILFSETQNTLEKDLLIDFSKSTAILHHRLDVAGVVKGYTVDKAKTFLQKNGWGNFIIDAGGDMFASGLGTTGSGWLIDVENIPENLITIRLMDESIATSGRTRRHWQINNKKYHHLINPKNPDEFSFALQTVTVIDTTTIAADAWAKILFIMGLKHGLEYANQNKIKALFLDDKNNFFPSKKLTENIHV